MSFVSSIHDRCKSLCTRAKNLSARKSISIEEEQSRKVACVDVFEECQKGRQYLHTLLAHAPTELFKAKDGRMYPGISVAYILFVSSSLLTHALSVMGTFDVLLDNSCEDIMYSETSPLDKHTSECLRMSAGICGGVCRFNAGESTYVNKHTHHAVHVTDIPIGKYTVSMTVRAWKQLSSKWENIRKEDYEGARKYRDVLLIQSEILSTTHSDLKAHPDGGEFDTRIGNAEIHETCRDYVRVDASLDAISTSPTFLAEVCIRAFLECCAPFRWDTDIASRVKEFPAAQCIGFAWRKVKNGKSSKFPLPPVSFLNGNQNRNAQYVRHVMNLWTERVEDEWMSSVKEEGTNAFTHTCFEAKYERPSTKLLFELYTRRLKRFSQYDCEEEMDSISQLQYKRSTIDNLPLRLVCSKRQMGVLDGVQYTAAISFIACRYFAANSIPISTNINFLPEDTLLCESAVLTERPSRKLIRRPNPLAGCIDVVSLLDKTEDPRRLEDHDITSPPWMDPIIISDSMALSITPVSTDTVLVKVGNSVIYDCPSMTHAILLVLCKIWSDADNATSHTDGKKLHPLSQNSALVSYSSIFLKTTFAPLCKQIEAGDC